MKNLHINDSYKIWSFKEMRKKIMETSIKQYESYNPEAILNRDFDSMYFEWLLHNVGYYISKPLCFMEYFENINLRCKDVDLEEKVYAV